MKGSFGFASRLRVVVGSIAVAGVTGRGASTPSTSGTSSGSTDLPATPSAGVTTTVGPRTIGAPTTVAAETTTAFSTSSAPSTPTRPKQIDEVFVALHRSMAALDGVYHSVRTDTYEGGRPASTSPVVTEVWVDARRDVARTTSGGATSTVVSEGVTFTWPTIHPQQRPYAPPSCFGVPAVVTLVLECPARDAIDGYAIEAGTVDGRAVLVLVTHRRWEALDATVRQSLEPVTMFPVRFDVEGTSDGEPYRATTRFVTDAVPAASLPADFFAPAAIGYVATDPATLLAVVPPGKVVYWLGPAYAGGAQVAGLELVSAYADPLPGSPVTLSYAFAARYASGPPVLMISTEPTGASASGDVWPACADTSAVRVGNGEVTFQCTDTPGIPPIMAKVVYPDAVVRVSSPGTCAANGCVDGPLSKLEVLLAVVGDLAKR